MKEKHEELYMTMTASIYSAKIELQEEEGMIHDDELDSGHGGVAGTVTAGISWKFVMSAIKPPGSSSRMEYIITLVSKT